MAQHIAHIALVVRDYDEAGVSFVRPPTDEVYGTVAVFEDLYGNRWDLVEYVAGHPMAQRLA